MTVSLGTSNSGVVTGPAASGTTQPTAISGAGHCRYTVSTPGDPVSFQNLGDWYMAEGTNYSFDITNDYAQSCIGEYNGGNYIFAAYASMENSTGYCNTDAHGPWSNVLVANTSYNYGPDVSTRSFGSFVSSTEDGTFFFGTYEVCQENPGGQTNNYLCQYWNAGPLF